MSGIFPGKFEFASSICEGPSNTWSLIRVELELEIRLGQGPSHNFELGCGLGLIYFRYVFPRVGTQTGTKFGYVCSFLSGTQSLGRYLIRVFSGLTIKLNQESWSKMHSMTLIYDFVANTWWIHITPPTSRCHFRSVKTFRSSQGYSSSNGSPSMNIDITGALFTLRI